MLEVVWTSKTALRPVVFKRALYRTISNLTDCNDLLMTLVGLASNWRVLRVDSSKPLSELDKLTSRQKPYRECIERPDHFKQFYNGSKLWIKLNRDRTGGTVVYTKADF